MQTIPENFTNVECTVPVNIRRWLPSRIDDNAFGVWIDAFSQYYQRKNLPQFSWGEALRSREGILDYLKNGGQHINVAKFKYMPDMRQLFLPMIGMNRTSSFDVSNLGGIEQVNKAADWHVGRMIFGRSAGVSGSAFSTGIVTGGDGCMTLAFSWQVGTVERELLEIVMEKVKLEIERIAFEG